MKKVLAILFCVFYLSFSVGMVLNFHYCGGKLKSVSVFKVKDCCKSKKKENKCCKNKTLVIKAKDSHEGASKQLLPNKPIYEIQLTITPTNDEAVPMLFALEHKDFLSNAPPHDSSTPTYLLNKVFRI